MNKSEGQTSKEFLQACQAGNLDKILELTKNHAIKDWTIFKHESMGDTPLHVAARNGNLNLVKFLLTSEFYDCKKCIVDVRNKDSKTPVHEAAQFSMFPALEYLIDKGRG